MSLGNDEKKFIELREGFVAELNELNEQLEELMERRNILVALLDGRLENNEPLQEFDYTKEDLDTELVDFVKKHKNVNRSDINNFFAEHDVDGDDVRRALERCKRRGLIKVNGRSKAAVWSAV